MKNSSIHIFEATTSKYLYCH